MKIVLALILLLGQTFPGGGTKYPPEAGGSTPAPALDCPCFTEASITAQTSTCGQTVAASCSTGGPASYFVVTTCGPTVPSVIGTYQAVTANPSCSGDETTSGGALTTEDPTTAQQHADCITELQNWEANNPGLCP